MYRYFSRPVAISSGGKKYIDSIIVMNSNGERMEGRNEVITQDFNAPRNDILAPVYVETKLTLS